MTRVMINRAPGKDSKPLDPAGVKGWGRPGELDLMRLRKLAKAG